MRAGVAAVARNPPVLEGLLPSLDERRQRPTSEPDVVAHAVDGHPLNERLGATNSDVQIKRPSVPVPPRLFCRADLRNRELAHQMSSAAASDMEIAATKDPAAISIVVASSLHFGNSDQGEGAEFAWIDPGRVDWKANAEPDRTQPSISCATHLAARSPSETWTGKSPWGMSG